MKKTIVWMLVLSLIAGLFSAAVPIAAEDSASDGDSSVQLKAPIAVEYALDEIGEGKADGVVTVTLPAGHRAEDIYLFWGDDNGKLPGYTALSPFKVSGNIVAHRMASGSYIPQGATRLLAFTYSDALGLSEGYASVELPQGAALTDGQLGTLLFEFQSVSDIHLTTTYAPRLHHSDHMRAMLEDIMEVSPNSIGIFNNGDTANNGKAADYQEFLDIYAEFEGAPIIYSGFGNHELFTNGTDKNYDSSDEAFTLMKNLYWEYMGDFVPTDATFCGGTRFGSLCFSFVRNDCKFIFLGTDVSSQNYLTLNDTTLAWLEDELESAGQGNPTFIIMHHPLPGTLAGTFKAKYGVAEPTATKLKEMLSNYPEVIMFNGHSHRDLNQYATNYVRDEKLPNIFGTSSVGYLARNYDSATTTETYVGSEGYYVYVYEDKVLVRGRDFLKGEWVSSAQFLVDLSDEALETVPDDEVEAPLYGSTASLSLDDNHLSGSVKCNMPINSNATTIALFFSSIDTGIIGSNPFATYEVTPTDNFFSCTIEFADVTMPYTADLILVYSYSDTLGWSADCDIIDLRTQVKGGGAPASGRFTMNKYSFTEGEQILVTAHENAGTSWIGIRNVASSDYRTWNYWRIADSGIGTVVDLSKDNSVFKRDFTALTPGIYEIAWIEVSGEAFQSSKKPENTTTFVIRSTTGNVSSSGAVMTNKSIYRLGEPIYVTALKGEADDWIGMQRADVTSGTKLWYNLGVSGVNEAFDITRQSNYTGVSGTDYKFGKLEEGTYKLAWLSSDKTNFQAGKAASDTVEFKVIDMSEVLALGVPVGDGITDPNDSVLNAALIQAAGLKQSHYTEETWQVLQDALSAAMLVRNDLDHTQEEIDAAYEAIADAIAALVEVPTKQPDSPQQKPTEPETDSTETTEDVAPDSQTATTDDDTDSGVFKNVFGCGGVVGLMPSCIMLALVPLILKKKK